MKITESTEAQRVYNNPKWKKVLLETPSGFALFEVDVFEEPDDIWVYFSDLTAEQFLFVLGFVKFNDKAAAWDGETRRSKDLMRLMIKLISLFNLLIFKRLLPKNCVADELVWGLKNILHGVLREEKYNITREYCLPMSKGLQRFLQDNLINVSQTMINADFLSEMGSVQYLNITLKKVPKILRESYDEYVCKIGDSIQNNLKYAEVLARILVPELTPVYDFSKMFSPDLVIKIQEAEKGATQYRKEKLVMRDRETIYGGLKHLVTVPNQRDDLMTRVKLTEAKLRRAEEETMTFRRTLLETPSGFAIFDVSERLFESQNIWSWFTDEMDARLVVLALGFVKVQDKSIAQENDNITYEYYHPPCMGLKSALTLHGVNVSPLEMDRGMVYYLGRLEYLEGTSRLVRTCFEKAFGHRVSQIGELIQDNLVYAQVSALILVPDSHHEFDLEQLSVDLAEKVVEAKNVAASEEAINKKTKKKTGKMAVQNVEKTAPEVYLNTEVMGSIPFQWQSIKLTYYVSDPSELRKTWLCQTISDYGQPCVYSILLSDQPANMVSACIATQLHE
ncbi:hypothetical protein U9M48_034590 [Paspalum notatum var. saurae]|uniref:Uncharacterized protein n=1 Tax=Paspalum notatum var. saurae TaxID=547442 RepID=A0AAQ3UCI4_PASNO